MTRLAAVLYFIRTCDHSPSVREIGEAVGLSSPSSVHRHLEELDRRGSIERVGPEKRIVVRKAA